MFSNKEITSRKIKCTWIKIFRSKCTKIRKDGVRNDNIKDIQRVALIENKIIEINLKFLSIYIMEYKKMSQWMSGHN